MYQLFQGANTDDVSMNAHVNHLRVDSSAFPPNVFFRFHNKSNNLTYFGSSIFQIVLGVPEWVNRNAGEVERDSGNPDIDEEQFRDLGYI